MPKEVKFFAEKDKKIWALTPKADKFESFADVAAELEKMNRAVIKALGDAEEPKDFSDIGRDNLLRYLQSCDIGLAHNKKLAAARLEEQIANPRLSQERLYQQSFIELGYSAGVLAVVAFTAFDDSQPEEWVIEGFLGDAIVPQVEVLPMIHPTVFGIDVEDQARLNRFTDKLYPV